MTFATPQEPYRLDDGLQLPHSMIGRRPKQPRCDDSPWSATTVAIAHIAIATMRWNRVFANAGKLPMIVG